MFNLRGVLWLGLYLLFILAPLFALMLGAMPPARGFWTEFAVALGYSGLAMMGLQFGLTARFRYVTAPWGEDVIYHFHRQVSLVAVGLVFAHPLIIFAAQPELLARPESGEIPLGAVAAVMSLGALAVLVIAALWRVKLKLSYELWHRTHIALALTAIIGGIVHMVGWSFYLQDPAKRALWIALVAFWIVLLVYVRLVKPLFLLRRPYRVAAVQAQRGDATSLVMEPVGHAGFAFTPGQFGWLTVWGGAFNVTAHPFSFSSSAEAAGGRVEMTIRKLGDFTSTIASVKVGQRVYLDGPYGAFTLGQPADMHVLIAGGIGITPMMSMLLTLADRGDKRPVVLFYGSADPDSTIFQAELEALLPRLDLKIVPVLSKPPQGWAGETGHITAELLGRHLPPAYDQHEYFICGPNPMMDAVETALGRLGVPMSKYHSERYSFA